MLGQLIGIDSEREALWWDLAEEVYNSQYPDTAYGVSLDNAVSITGTERKGAAKSRVLQQILFGQVGSPIPAGTIISVNGNSAARFLTDAEVLLVAGTDAVQSVGFSAVPNAGTWKLRFKGNDTSALPYNAAAGDVQAALNALPGLTGLVVAGNYSTGFVITFSGDSGKQAQPLLVASLSALSLGASPVVITIATTTVGVPQGVVSATAETTGPLVAPTGTLTIIETPVTGLSRTLNIVDADVGSAVESDAALRLRREDELQGTGSATVEAIRAAARAVTGVVQAIVFENDAKIEIDGRPPGSIEAFVQGGADSAIRDALWEVKGGGIPYVGNVVGNITDSQGIAHTIRFSRPVVVPIFIAVKLTKDSSAPADLAAQARAVLASYIAGLEIGQDIIVYPTLIAQLVRIPGIIDVEIGIGTTANPPLGQDSNIVLAVNQIAMVQNVTTDITVTVA